MKLEWLEDSLLSKKRRPKRETEYLWYQTRGTRKRDTVKKTNAVMDMDAVDPGMLPPVIEILLVNVPMEKWRQLV